MSSATTQTTICNRALQLLGYQPIGSINDNNRGARAMQRAYEPVRLAVLRENFWSFSLKRAILPAAAVTPSFGKANYFILPGDFLMIAPPDQFVNFGVLSTGLIPSAPNTGVSYQDWAIESYPGGGNAIASDNPAPLYLRYVSSDIPEGSFDPSFAEAFSAMLAMETCEELTQSNTKMATASKAYDDAINLAKKRNAFELMPVQPPVDPWLLVRM